MSFAENPSYCSNLLNSKPVGAKGVDLVESAENDTVANYYYRCSLDILSNGGSVSTRLGDAQVELYYKRYPAMAKESADVMKYILECAFISLQKKEVVVVTSCLNIFLKKNVYSLPSQYVLHRWTLNAKKDNIQGLIIEELHEGGSKASSTLLFNKVKVHSLDLSKSGSRSEQHHDIAIQYLQNACDCKT
ncbi:hypothetical protein MTR_6g024175 [Medicago truncatula]|uniref:Protein FAR1-RELATED SEQUENCE n=1 Tax=Medicago truncatula TaxID=3880 RepID=A0A072UI58_MEDTR|nr:hypothetical protein MTR_6g024175 [Medicago truncatula]